MDTQTQVRKMIEVVKEKGEVSIPALLLQLGLSPNYGRELVRMARAMDPTLIYDWPPGQKYTEKKLFTGKRYEQLKRALPPSPPE